MPGARRSLAAALAVLTLTACGSANGGAQAASDFDDWLAEHPFDGMRVADSTSAQGLPFSGSADITVAVAATDVEAGARHVCGFEPRAAATVRLSVAADGVAVPVDCADPAGTADTWRLLADLDGLEEVEIGPGEATVRFADTRSALAGWDAVRRLPSASFTLEAPADWTLADRPGTTADARAIVRDAMASIYVVESATLTPTTPARDEHVELVVAFDGPLLEQELLAGHPERRGRFTVVEPPYSGPGTS